MSRKVVKEACRSLSEGSAAVAENPSEARFRRGPGAAPALREVRGRGY